MTAPIATPRPVVVIGFWPSLALGVGTAAFAIAGCVVMVRRILS